MKKILMTLVIVSMLLVSVGVVMAAKPADKGFDKFGYNYQARVFVGAADGVDRSLDGTVWGDPTYANDHLVMKWSKAWDDARFGTAPWTCDAWEDNEWNGMGQDGSQATEHAKIVWVGPEKYDLTGTWNFDFVLGGGDYFHTMTITSFDPVTGAFTGTGSYDADSSYTWDVTGTFSGNTVTFTIVYTGSNPDYTVSGTGTLSSDGKTITGTADGPGQEFTFTADGSATVYNQCGREEAGGYRIWNEFLAIMDHGIVDGEHQWFAHAKPTGYGAN